MQMDFSLERKHQQKGSCPLHALGWCFNLKILFLFATWSWVVNTVSYWFNITTLLLCWYRIAESFRGRKLLRIGENYNFHGENLRRLLTSAAPKDVMPPKFCGENFRESPQNHEIRKSFLLRKFSAIRYAVHTLWYKESELCHYKPVNHRTQLRCVCTLYFGIVEANFVGQPEQQFPHCFLLFSSFWMSKRWGNKHSKGKRGGCVVLETSLPAFWLSCTTADSELW